MKKKIYSYAYTAPWLLIYFAFFLLPTFLSFFFAFTNWNLKKMDFIGFDNFVELFSSPLYLTAFKNTFLFTFIAVTVSMVLSLALALALNRKLYTKNLLRTIYFIPVVLSYVMISLMFVSLLHPTSGAINNLLRSIGLGSLARDWLVEKNLIIPTLAVIDIWKGLGFHMTIFLAGLQTLPAELYESSKIDGASSWDQFRYITLPLLTPTIKSNLLLALISRLKVFDIVLVTTQGGPGYLSEVLKTSVYRAFGMQRYGLACCGELCLFIIILIITSISNKFLEKKEAQIQ